MMFAVGMVFAIVMNSVCNNITISETDSPTGVDGEVNIIHLASDMGVLGNATIGQTFGLIKKLDSDSNNEDEE